MTPFPCTDGRRGFTLVELVLAAILSVFVAAAATTSISQLLRARSSADARQQAHSRADAAGAMIANDLRNAVRNADLLFAQVTIRNGVGLNGDGDSLLLLAKGSRPVRGDSFSPEGEEYEVQYRVEPDGNDRPSLWRRMDPAFDPYIDGGGIAAPVVPGVVSLTLLGYDGSAWYEEWRSDEHGMPHAVKLTVVGVSDNGRERVTSQRIVAIDRVPLPPPASEEEVEAGMEGEASPRTPAPGTSGTGGAGTGGTGTGGSGTGSAGSGGGGTGGGGAGSGGAGGGGTGAPR